MADVGVPAPTVASDPRVRTTEAASPTCNVGQCGVGSDGAAFADPGAAQQLGAGPDDGVAADGHVDVDPGGGRVDHGHPGPLVPGDHAPVQLGAQRRQLHPVVDPGHQRGVVDVVGVQ